jgi:hypothetical protein
VGPMARSFPLVSGAVQGPECRHWEGGQPVAEGELLPTRVQDDARAEPVVQSPGDVAQAAQVVGRVDGLYGLDLDTDHGPVGVLQDHVFRHADQPAAEPGVGDDQLGGKDRARGEVGGQAEIRLVTKPSASRSR